MYKPYKPQPQRINYKINHLITAPELRVVDENGEMIGVLPRDAALKLAIEKGLDLVEIAPTANPPVAKIISFDKFRYQKEKEMKKLKAAQKISQLKEIQISVREAKNDMLVKIKKIESFAEEGHKIQITVTLRGREKYNREWANTKLNEFLQLIPFEYKVIMEPKFGGRGMLMQITKK